MSKGDKTFIVRNEDIEKEIMECLATDSYVQKIAASIESYHELSSLEKDFAYRLATEPPKKTAEWANFYKVTKNCITLMKKKPEVVSLINEIKYNLRVYTASKQVLLYKMALDQYDRIFSIAENDDNIESKRKAAHDIIEFWHTGASGGKFTMADDQTDLENDKKSNVEITDLTSAKQRLLEIQQLKAQIVKPDDEFSAVTKNTYAEKIIEIEVEKESDNG